MINASNLLNANYEAFLEYIENSADDTTAYRLKRLLFRMLGIYHGFSLDQPKDLDFYGDWLPDGNYFKASELTLGYETEDLTFMDVYFINAYCDLMDVISFSPEAALEALRLSDRPDKCSGFLKRTRGEVILTHNTWFGFLSQTMTQTLAVNDDLMTFNAITPGVIGSNTDFGYNNKGIMFNETTHRASRSQVKPLGIWTFWRAALAEQFSSSIQDFFDAISIDNTGTYQNNPLSIFGRWDLGYGETDYPKQIPDGAIDSKVGTSQMVRSFMELIGILDTKSRATGFWMLYGVAYIHGKPFIWSESLWSRQKLRDVPDRLDGHFTLMPIYLR